MTARKRFDRRGPRRTRGGETQFNLVARVDGYRGDVSSCGEFRCTSARMVLICSSVPVMSSMAGFTVLGSVAERC